MIWSKGRRHRRLPDVLIAQARTTDIEEHLEVDVSDTGTRCTGALPPDEAAPATFTGTLRGATVLRTATANGLITGRCVDARVRPAALRVQTIQASARAGMNLYPSYAIMAKENGSGQKIDSSDASRNS
jgi:hypothetical protein